MQYHQQVENAIKQFGQSQNIAISMSHGASVLSLSDNREIWLESPQDSELFIVHMAVKEQADFQAYQDFWKSCLLYNSHISLSQGSWLSFHRETNTLRLCVALPKKFIDKDVIQGVVDQLVILSKEFDRHLHDLNVNAH